MIILNRKLGRRRTTGWKQCKSLIRRIFLSWRSKQRMLFKQKICGIVSLFSKSQLYALSSIVRFPCVTIFLIWSLFATENSLRANYRECYPRRILDYLLLLLNFIFIFLCSIYRAFMYSRLIHLFSSLLETILAASFQVKLSKLFTANNWGSFSLSLSSCSVKISPHTLGCN